MNLGELPYTANGNTYSVLNCSTLTIGRGELFMPIIKKIELDQPDSNLLLWEISESMEELRAMYARLFPTVPVPVIKLAKREMEYMVGRLLLHEALPGSELQFRGNGKPILAEPYHVSFSHTLNTVGLVVAKYPVGLDMQWADEKLLRIKEKYCHADELIWLDALQNPLQGALLIWSAKEAVFKVFGEWVDFAEHIRVAPMDLDSTTFTAQYEGLHGQYTFAMSRMQVGPIGVVWTGMR
jgi:4'-phosphopantetheinyl transferase